METPKHWLPQEQPHVPHKHTFRVDPIYRSHDMLEQIREVKGRYTMEELLLTSSGKQLKRPHEFHTPLYRDLLLNVVPLRKEFRQLDDPEARRQMAKCEFDHWLNYLTARKEEIKELGEKRKQLEEDVDGKEQLRDSLLHYNHSISEMDKGRMKDYFDRYKDRKTLKLPASKLTDFHGEYAKMFRFAVPLHPKNLAQLVHPYQGYLGAFRGRSFDWDELLEVYDNQIAASFEKCFGRELLGDELSCLTFWLIADRERKGWMSLAEFKHLLRAFKFYNVFLDQDGKWDSFLTVEKLQKEFAFNLLDKPHELLPKAIKSKDSGLTHKDTVIRFDFAREIFLERGL